MHLTDREIWTALHGLVLGGGFLLLFSAGFFALSLLRANHFSPAGLNRFLRHMGIGSWAIALLTWMAVLVGTYCVYPMYRAKAPSSARGLMLMAYPKYFLLSSQRSSDWHEFGMEWKEHLAWLSPILLTAVAFLITVYGRRLAEDLRLRRAVLFLYTIAFFSAAVAGVLGALINKAAPVR